MTFARNFFNEQEQELVVEAIAKAELNTSAEIRVHIENFCFGDELKAAMKTFSRLGMDKTNERNGVLIYIASVSRKVAVVGDAGIHEKLGNDFWNTVVANLIKQFKANKKAESLAQCILDCGEQLSRFFPRTADDKNELSNNLSFK